jgi:imidazolonepropionase-like amidohydrolase
MNGARFTIGLVLACIACVRAAPSLVPVTAPGPTYEYRNGLWYDDGKFVRRTFYSVNGVLRDERPSVVDSVLDLAGGYVIPPFGDAHTHNLDGARNIDAMTKAYLDEGTFYVQVLTNSRSGAEAVRSRFNKPCTLDVQYANGGVTGTLSHPFLAYEPRAMGLFDYAQWRPRSREIWQSRRAERQAYWFIDDSAQLAMEWPRILDGQPDLIKIFLLHASETAQPPPDTGLQSGHGLKPSLVPLIVRRAHDAGLRVAAHVETAADFAIAVVAGVDVFAHMPGYEMPEGDSVGLYEITEEAAREAGKRGVVVIPTASRGALAFGAKDSAQVVRVRRDLMRRNLAMLMKHSVRIAIGSDWFGQTARREYDALQALGLWDARGLLDLWASVTPQSMYPGRAIGRLAQGYEASFLVLRADPLTTPITSWDIRERVKQGCVTR